ncbi:MAG: hypothetical protein HY074_14715 [Deltaproteobacteria bacterium]|nr:hypothetical protein [Deltaproteobacteria bacterium]
MRRPNIILVTAALCSTLATAAGCSLKPGNAPSIRIRLAESGAPGNSALDTALGSAFSILSSITIPSTLTSLSQLNCFAVNARSGLIPTSPVCNSNVLQGIADGMRAGIGSTFQVNIPVSDGIVFEAYGTSSPTCPDISQGSSSLTQEARIGSVTTSAADLAKTVTIPVSFDPTQAYSCSSAVPFVIVFDSLLYPPAAGFLTTIANSTWNTMGSSTSLTTKVSGPAGIGLDLLNSDIGATGSSTFANVAVARGHAGAALYYLSAVATALSVSGSPGQNMTVAIGMGNGTNANPGAVLGCSVTWTQSALTSPSFVVGTGGSTNLLVGSNATATAVSTPDGQATISCFFVKQPDGSYLAGGTLVDSSGVSHTATTASFADPCGAGGCVVPYVSATASAGNTTGAITSFLAVEADSL